MSKSTARIHLLIVSQYLADEISKNLELLRNAERVLNERPVEDDDLLDELADLIQDLRNADTDATRLHRQVRKKLLEDGVLPKEPTPEEKLAEVLNKCRSCGHYSDSHSFYEPRRCAVFGCTCNKFVS